jgi:CRISPR-associated exonuclease Cas4
LIGVLILLALSLAVGGVALLVWSRRAYRQTGLPPGRVIAADTSRWRRAESPLISRRWGLVGRPDYLMATADGMIPVEVKASRRPAAPYLSHLLQLAAYCLLVEETSGRRPPYGILHYSDATLAIPFDDALRQSLIETMAALRRDETRPVVARSHAEAERCRRCGVRYACDQRLAD